MSRMPRDDRDAEYAKDAEYASISGIPGMQGCLEMTRMLGIQVSRGWQGCKVARDAEYAKDAG